MKLDSWKFAEMKKTYKIPLCLLLILSCIILFNISIGCSKDKLTKNDPFGVLVFLHWNHFWNNYMYKTEQDVEKAIKKVKGLGVSFVRADFPWNNIEETKGIFDFKRYDYIVEACTKHNIQIVGVLGYSAPWTGAEWNNPPPNQDDFINYVEVVSERYKGKIKYWEIWNEPDSSTYWTLKDNLKTYTELLKKSYRKLKEVDSSFIVVLGGMTDEGYYALKNIIHHGGAEYFDIFNFHPFVDPLGEDPMKMLGYRLKPVLRELKKNSLNKKIWITEIGCPGVIKPTKENAWFCGTSTDEKQQADFLKDVYEYLLGHEEVEKIFWAFLQDTQQFHTGVDNFGLLRHDYSSKPAYETYKSIIKDWKRNNRNNGTGPQNAK